MTFFPAPNHHRGGARERELNILIKLARNRSIRNFSIFLHARARSRACDTLQPRRTEREIQTQHTQYYFYLNELNYTIIYLKVLDNRKNTKINLIREIIICIYSTLYVFFEPAVDADVATVYYSVEISPSLYLKPQKQYYFFVFVF